MAGEFGALIFVDGVSDVSVRALHEDLATAADAALGRVAGAAACALGDDGGW